jgi:hypothetical protein
MGSVLKQVLVCTVQPGDWIVEERLNRMPSRGPWRAERPGLQQAWEKEECS